MKEQRQGQVSLYKCLKLNKRNCSICFHYNYSFPCAFDMTKFLCQCLLVESMSKMRVIMDYGSAHD